MTKTKTITKTKLMIAVLFLAAASTAASFGAGIGRAIRRQQQTNADRQTFTQTQFTATFCLGETAVAPKKSRLTVSPELFGVKPALAAEGTLVVEVLNELGQQVPADIEVRRPGQTTILRTFSALTGEGAIALEEGRYRVRAITRSTPLSRGELDVEVAAGRTYRYVVRVYPIPLTTTVPQEEPATAAQPGQRDLGAGTVRVIVGNICDGDNNIIDTGGLVVVRRDGTGVGNTNVSHGAFEIYDLANGTYNLQFQNPGLGFIDETVTLAPKRVNFEVESN